MKDIVTTKDFIKKEKEITLKSRLSLGNVICVDTVLGTWNFIVNPLLMIEICQWVIIVACF